MIWSFVDFFWVVFWVVLKKVTRNPSWISSNDGSFNRFNRRLIEGRFELDRFGFSFFYEIQDGFFVHFFSERPAAALASLSLYWFQAVIMARSCFFRAISIRVLRAVVVLPRHVVGYPVHRLL
jgi:hypothetical protein